MRKQLRGDIAGALGHFRAVLRRDAHHPHALYFAGLACQQLQQYDMALKLLYAVVHEVPTHADAWYNLARIFQTTKRPEEAIVHYVAALEQNPNHLESLLNLGNLYREFGYHDVGNVLYDHALWQDNARPEARYMRSFVKLSLGDYEGGWADHEARFQCPLYIADHKRGFMDVLPRWNGERSPNNCLLIHWEQGFGDTLQFLRYVRPAIERFGGPVIIEMQQALVRLAARSFPEARVFCIGDDLPMFDRHVSVVSLPSILGGFGDAPPYLVAESRFVGKPLSVNDVCLESPNMRVGVCWAGNTQQLNDFNRSLSAFEGLALILAVPNIEWLSLQVGERAHECGDMPRIDPKDFADTADEIANLDLVITVDTSIAHVAGAIGKPVWIMVPPSHDWRYPREGDSTVWYPTARLFRQTKRQQWSDVVERIAQALRELRAA